MRDILEEMDVARVFSIALNSDKTQIEFTEECDVHFTHSLTKTEFGKMINELQIIHAGMNHTPKSLKNR